MKAQERGHIERLLSCKLQSVCPSLSSSLKVVKVKIFSLSKKRFLTTQADLVCRLNNIY